MSFANVRRMPEPSTSRRWPWVVAALLILAALFSQSFEFQIALDGDIRDTQPVEAIEQLREREDLNVLFVLIDTLRADRLGTYGYERDTSPHLDRLAARGVRFERQLAQSSWTKASMASLWTSLNPARSGVTRFDDVIPEDAVMPAEQLKQAGFRTAALFRNGWVSSNFGFGQGFDVYVRPSSKPLPKEVRLENPTLSQKGTDADVFEAAREFLRVHGRERWFLYIHLMDIHEFLYDERFASFGSSSSDLYDNSIFWVDNLLGDFFQHLAEEGYSDDLLTVVSSDHGEAFMERGLEGHARHVFRETTEVPFLISFPFRLDPGIAVQSRSRNIDVWPTILDLIGIEPPDYIDGTSQLPAMLASARGEQTDNVAGIAELDMHWGQRGLKPAPAIAVTQGSWRYVREDKGNQRTEHLYNASQDPAELRDQAGETPPPELAELRTLAEGLHSAAPQWGEAPTRELSELELNQLRALGYALP